MLLRLEEALKKQRKRPERKGPAPNTRKKEDLGVGQASSCAATHPCLLCRQEQNSFCYLGLCLDKECEGVSYLVACSPLVKAVTLKLSMQNVRVVQRNLVYLVGLAMDICYDDLLRGSEYLGRFGKPVKARPIAVHAAVLLWAPC